MKFQLILGSLLLTITQSWCQKFEAENASLEGVMTETIRSGYSGNGYVTGFDETGDQVVFRIEAATPGLYELIVGYASPHGNKTNDVYVNDAFAGSHVAALSQVFRADSFGKIRLEHTSNTIRITKNWGYFDLDYIELVPAVPNEINNYPDQLSNPMASNEAKVVYQYLRDLYGHRVLSGQQTYDGNDIETDFLLEVSGRHPAIKGFDLMDYSPSRTERGTTSQHIPRAIEWGTKGGMVTLMWHWNAPKDLYDTEENPWWSGFYTEATSFDVSKAYQDPGSEEYALIVRDIDLIASYLKEVEETGIPVLWRPLHEAEGGWFWWGAKGAAPCVWLWRFMYDRLTIHHQINNLIWVWTGTDSGEAMSWYPGDEYVDIIGADIYLPNRNYSSNFRVFDAMAGIHEGGKILTLSETGTLPDPDALREEESFWSWFNVWSGDFIFDPEINERDHISYVYNHDYVITFDELPDFTNYDSPGFPEEPVTSVDNNPEVFSIYPNPTTGILILTQGQEFSERIEVRSVSGRTVMIQLPEAQNEITLDLSHLPAGLYSVTIYYDTKVYTHRILKTDN